MTAMLTREELNAELSRFYRARLREDNSGLDIGLMRRTVAERMRDVKLSDLSRGSFVDVMRRCMYGDGDQSDAWECYDLMADLCTLLDPDGDPEPEASDD